MWCSCTGAPLVAITRRLTSCNLAAGFCCHLSGRHLIFNCEHAELASRGAVVFQPFELATYFRPRVRVGRCAIRDRGVGAPPRIVLPLAGGLRGRPGRAGGADLHLAGSDARSLAAAPVCLQQNISVTRAAVAFPIFGNAIRWVFSAILHQWVRPLTRYLSMLGRNSLIVFCMLSLLSLAGQLVHYRLGLGLIVDILIVGLGMTWLGFTAWVSELRERLQPRS